MDEIHFSFGVSCCPGQPATLCSQGCPREVDMQELVRGTEAHSKILSPNGSGGGGGGGRQKVPQSAGLHAESRRGIAQ